MIPSTAGDWKRVHRDATVIDLHIHPSMKQQLFNRRLGVRYFAVRTINVLGVQSSFPRMKTGQYDAFLSVLHVPEKGLLKDFPIINVFRVLRPDLWRKLFAPPPFTATLTILNDMETEAVKWPEVKMAHSVTELDAILAQPAGTRPIAVVHAVEGAHSLGDDKASEDEVLANLEELYRRGVAYITLAHFYRNRVVHPCYPFPEQMVSLARNPDLWRDLTRGLTPLGERVVKRMIDLGMLIDLSHSTPAARQRVYELCEASGKRVPLMATHVGAYEINPSPYNLSDWEVRRIARDGGVVGVIFMPYWLMPKGIRHGPQLHLTHHCTLRQYRGRRRRGNWHGLRRIRDAAGRPVQSRANAAPDAALACRRAQRRSREENSRWQRPACPARRLGQAVNIHFSGEIMTNRFLARLATGEVLVADGATGTNLQKVGLQSGTSPEDWVFDQPDQIVALHRAWVDAGSDIILTCTFGGTRLRLKDSRYVDRAPELNRRAVELATRGSQCAP